MPGFRKATLVGNILRKIALQERWIKETISVAAIFSRRCSRVGKIQAFEDGLTDDDDDDDDDDHDDDYDDDDNNSDNDGDEKDDDDFANVGEDHPSLIHAKNV